MTLDTAIVSEGWAIVSEGWAPEGQRKARRETEGAAGWLRGPTEGTKEKLEDGGRAPDA